MAEMPSALPSAANNRAKRKQTQDHNRTKEIMTPRDSLLALDNGWWASDVHALSYHEA